VTRGGLNIFVRPIKPEDEPLLLELFHTLSPKSIFQRFSRMITNLPHKILARLTQIDYDQDAVLVALMAEKTGEKMIGVCRLTQVPGSRKAELGIVVGDPWQGKGVGATILENCIPIARERGIESIWGLVLAENTTMLSLAREQRFTIKKSVRADQYEITINLKKDV
jgi:acetyltransferase